MRSNCGCGRDVSKGDGNDMRFANLMDSADLLKDDSVEYNNISIVWEIETINCLLFGDTCCTMHGETIPSHTSVMFEIIIHKSTIQKWVPCFNHKNSSLRERRGRHLKCV